MSEERNDLRYRSDVYLMSFNSWFHSRIQWLGRFKSVRCDGFVPEPALCILWEGGWMDATPQQAFPVFLGNGKRFNFKQNF